MQDTMTRYEELNAAVLAARAIDPKGDAFYAAVDALLSEAVAAPQSDFGNERLRVEVEDVFNQRDGEEREDFHKRVVDRDFLSSLAPETQAVAAVRSLLSVHKVTFDPTGLASWDAFSERYQDLILKA